MASQFYPQQIQYAQGLAQMDPQNGPMLLASTLQAAFQGNNEIMKRLIETFDIQNPDVYLPDIPEPAAPGLQQPGAPGAGPGVQAAPLGGTAGPSPLAQGGDQIAQLLGAI